MLRVGAVLGSFCFLLLVLGLACTDAQDQLPSVEAASSSSATGSAEKLHVSPNPCTLGDGGRCTVEMSWENENADYNCLFLKMDDETLKRINCSRLPVEISWITNRKVEFQLRDSRDPSSALLGRVEVRGE